MILRRVLPAFAIAVVLSATIAHAQDVPITHADLTVVAKSTPLFKVTIENRYHKPLQEVAFRLTSATAAVGAMTSTHYLHAGDARNALLQPGATRAIDIDLRSNPDLNRIAIASARFTNGFEATTEVSKYVSIVSQQLVLATTYSATVRNLGNLPIEAFSIDELNANGSPSSTHGVDYCTVDSRETPVDSGRILPGMSREVPLSTPPQETASLPRARLAYVLFDDLTFEGRAQGRQDLLRRREQLAAEYASAIDVLHKAVALPAEGAIAFMNGKKSEWRGNTRLLDEGIRIFQANRQLFALRLESYVQTLTSQHARLVRHTKRQP